MIKKKLFRVNLSMELKILKSVLWNVVLYAAESRTMTPVNRKRLETMEIWIWRRMEKISSNHYRMRKTTRGRKRMHLLSDLMENISYTKIKRVDQDRAGWKVKMSQTCW